MRHARHPWLAATLHVLTASIAAQQFEGARPLYPKTRPSRIGSQLAFPEPPMTNELASSSAEILER